MHQSAVSQTKDTPSPQKPNTRLRAMAMPMLMFFVISLGIIALGYQYYVTEKGRIVTEKYNALSAVAEEKEKYLTSWLLARARDAQRPAKGPFFRNALGEWISSLGDPSCMEAWKNRLIMDREEFGYEDVLLLDASGELVLLAAKDDPDPIGPPTQEAVRKAKDIGGPALSEPYVSSQGMVLVDAVCPVFNLDGRILAFLVLRADLGDTLFHAIQSCPIPSPSAEVLIVKQEGDDVVFLNGPRHRKVAPFGLRISHTLSDLVEVQAVKGNMGMVLGQDYRGVKVLADLRPVRGTSWFLVTKVDTEEILEEAQYRGKVVGLMALMAVVLAGSLLGLWFRHTRARLWRRLYTTEKELREAQEEFRTTLYSIGDAVITTDRWGNIRLMNRIAEDLTGWQEKEAMGRPIGEIFRIVNEETRAQVEDPVKRVLREGRVVGLGNHTLLLSRDGREIPIADSGAPIVDEEEGMVGVVLVFRDQSEERALRRQIEKSRKEWEEIFQAVGHPIHILDPTYTIVEANRAALEFMGLAKDEILGRKCYELFHGAEAPVPGCPSKVVLETKREAFSEQMAFGRNVLVSCTPVFNDKGEIERIIHVVTDVTSLKMAERALGDSEEKFRVLVENSSHGILVVRGEKIVYANPKALEFFGASMEEVSSCHYLDFTHPEDKPLIQERYRRMAAGEEVTPTVVFRILDKRGNLRWVESHSSRITWGGKEAYIIFLEDVTSKRKEEEERMKLEVQLLQAQKMEAIARLAGGVAHDFNNILAIIGGHAELGLAKLEGGHPVQENLREILEATGRSANLVRQLLAFARKQIISPMPLDMNEAIEGMLKMLRRLIGEDIELEWHPGRNLWKVYMDPSQLDQILANLVVNARDAIQGPGKVTIETENVELDEDYCKDRPGTAPGNYVMLAVSDNGCGMDKETLEKIFEPFFTTKGPEKGTGLGLATVYGIVKQNRGHVNVYSEPGKGTTFKIYIPKLEEPQQAEKPEEIALVARDLPKGSETVLLVEDERPLLKVYTRFLETLGYRVISARTPREALLKAQDHKGSIELLLTDVVMPQMSGRELWNKLRTLRPEMKCIFMSGYTANVIAHHGVLEPGMNFIGKPFTIEALAVKLRQVLEGE